ncbi:tellurite resistance protein [Mucilaginibacter sp. UYP25]|uniref:SLAC1 anion channel family protein n=1 Tax=unclassified Mucilaginibacter TaxID=2617802 RepID=UPI003397DCAF
MKYNQRLSFLEFLPISLFGGVMALCGLCFSWRLAATHWHMNYLIGESIGVLAVVAFITLTVTYFIKCLKYSSSVTKEFQNPISVCFFATFIISVLLLPGVLLPYFPKTAEVTWTVGAVLMFAFAWYVLRKWFDQRQESENAVPAWLLPVVGTLDIPIVGNHLPLKGVHEVSLIAFGIGLIFSIILLTIIFSRLLFQISLPESVQPTLLILTGPLALAFSVYHGLTGVLDLFAGVLFYFNLFILLLFGSKIMLIPAACPFKVSWWSVSFPLTAVTFSTLVYSEYHADLAHQLLAISMLFITTIVIAYILFLTIYMIITQTFAPLINN